MNNDYIKWLDEQRIINGKYFTIYEICKAVKKHPNNSVYRKFNRMASYDLLDYKYSIERHAILYRRKKTK